MAADRITPVDELIGLPLPIWPNNNLPPKTELPTHDNPHHHFHPENSEIINIPEEGKFLRNSRIQILPRWIHNEYHKKYVGPELPETEEKRLLLGVFAVAGYLPKYAINAPESVKKDKDIIIPIDAITYSSMIKRTQLRCEVTKSKERSENACAFIMRVVFKQEISTINQFIVEEFLDTKDETIRLERGMQIIDELIQQSTEPIEPIYRFAYKNNMIRRSDIKNAGSLVRKITKQQQPKYIKYLKEQLETTIAA